MIGLFVRDGWEGGVALVDHDDALVPDPLTTLVQAPRRSRRLELFLIVPLFMQLVQNILDAG